jgi:branched-chain amino acid transport system substrate-binding protein
MFMKNGSVRKDGLVMHDMYLAQVKTPAQSKAPWDYYNIVRTLPAESVYGSESESSCPLLKH